MDIEKLLQWLYENNATDSYPLSEDRDTQEDVKKAIELYEKTGDLDKMLKDIHDYDHHTQKRIDLLGCLIRGGFFEKSKQTISGWRTPKSDNNNNTTTKNHPILGFQYFIIHKIYMGSPKIWMVYFDWKTRNYVKISDETPLTRDDIGSANSFNITQIHIDQHNPQTIISDFMEAFAEEREHQRSDK